MLIIPGGKYVGEVIDTNRWIPQLIEAFNTLEQPLAAICAGPRFLGRAGLLDTVPFTAYPGSEIDMKGSYQPDTKALTHGRIITGRSAGSVYDFAYEIVHYLQGQTQAYWLKENILE
jgi:4-methyl-5(b-hydroxyethyl)-thiazole monophosphate biosynthesis